MDQDKQGDYPGDWLPIAEAARRLGVTPKAIRNRILHHSIEWRPAGNKGREVLVTPEMEEEAGDSPEDKPETVPLMVQVARLEERLAASERAREETTASFLRREADLVADRDQHRVRADRQEAELARLRRPLWERIIEAWRRG